MSATTDESTEMLIVTTLLVVCLRTAAGKPRDPQSFYFDLEHVKCSVNAQLFYAGLSNSLQKSDFSTDYIKKLDIICT
jgi:hypothetical protein